MTVTGLHFETCWTIPYPVATNGTGTALTICLRNNDPYLAFLTQTGWDDEIVYLHRMGSEDHRHPTPPGEETISGMGYDPFRRVIWCAKRTTNSDTIVAIDPDTEAVTATILAPPSIPGTPDGLACNGFFFVRAVNNRLELFGAAGTALGTRDYPGRTIRGISASPWSYTFIDSTNDEIVVIGPLGDEIAVSSGIGAAGGMHALAFDYITHHTMDNSPQVWLPDGTVTTDGSIHDPSTPWSPQPWGGRHRLYVANETDQTIYAGYLAL